MLVPVAFLPSIIGMYGKALFPDMVIIPCAAVYIIVSLLTKNTPSRRSKAPRRGNTVGKF